MILVAGATGLLGGMIARRLLEQGREVRVLVRPGSDHGALVEAGAEAVFGDLKDPASLEQACAGVDTVVTTANSAARGGDDTVETVELRGNRNLIDAARAAGVRHFVFTSALGASEESPVPFLAAKAAAERHLRESGLSYTILVPNVFMEIWFPMLVAGPVQAGQPVALYGEARRKHTFVSVSDVAAFAVAAVDHPSAVGRSIPIGGPAALSWRDVVVLFERVLGREIPVRSLGPGESLPGLPPTVSQIAAGFETYDSPLETTETAATFGVTLTDAESVIRRLLPPPAATAR
jgi:uncharacterized protein YbjT (DUF2867 family)